MKKEFTVEGTQQKNPHGFGGMVSRAAPIKERATIDFEKGIETIATTEAPALVVDWERWEVVREILPMRYMEAPNNDKVPLLDSHSRVSTSKVLGSAKNFTIEGDKLMAKTFVSAAEDTIKQKISEGHLDSVSIGYMTDKEFTVEVPKKATVVIDGLAFRNDYTDDVPLLVRTWWKTHELSLVPIGADEAAKFKNVADMADKKFMDKIKELSDKIDGVISETRTITIEGKGISLTKLKHELFKLKNS